MCSGHSRASLVSLRRSFRPEAPGDLGVLGGAVYLRHFTATKSRQRRLLLESLLSLAVFKLLEGGPLLPCLPCRLLSIRLGVIARVSVITFKWRCR